MTSVTWTMCGWRPSSRNTCTSHMMSRSTSEPGKSSLPLRIILTASFLSPASRTTLGTCPPPSPSPPSARSLCESSDADENRRPCAARTVPCVPSPSVPPSSIKFGTEPMFWRHGARIGEAGSNAPPPAAPPAAPAAAPAGPPPVDPSTATPVLVLDAMVSKEDLASAEEMGEILEDARSECSKHGAVSLYVPKPGVSGPAGSGAEEAAIALKLFAEYGTAAEALACGKELHGKQFDGRTVLASFLPPEAFQAVKGLDCFTA
mmetsp:Transcript_19855/g.58630  ORF Transcript_19855/g.58630 Transcript_19855/m.58630 type:complete len:262 (-) Transcript_19855:67-852(-)